MSRSVAAALAAIVVVSCLGGCTDAAPPTADERKSTKASESASDSGPAATDLFHTEVGPASGTPLLFVHGGPGANAVNFEQTAAPLLAQRGFRVISYDQRGSGRSPAANAADLTVAKFVNDLANVIAVTGAKQPVLLGHSWGGPLALRFMHDHPGVVKGTVLIAAPIDFPTTVFSTQENTITAYQRRPFSDDDIATEQQLHARMFPRGLTPPYSFAVEDCGATMEKAFSAGLYFPNPVDGFGALTTWPQLLIGPNSELITKTETSVFLGLETHDHLMETDFTPFAKEALANLYGIYGDQDGLFRPVDLKTVASVLGPSRFTLVRGASHFVFIDQSDAFLAALDKGLRTLGAH